MLKVLGLDEINEWHDILSKFKTVDNYYFPEYVKGFKVHGDGEPALIYYESDSMIGINVVMKRDIAKIEKFSKKIEQGKYFDFSTPYGYGGFILEGKVSEINIEKLRIVYEEYCINNNIITEFVRFHPIINNSIYNKDIYSITDLGPTVTISLDSKSEIWENLSGKNRNVIRKAMKLGVRISWGMNNDLLESFMLMYNTTMDRDNASDYYYFEKEYYESILNDLRYNSLFFYAEYEGEIISMALILFSNDKLNYHLSASNRDYQRLSATNLLLYEVACWGEANGYKTFHLGGGLGSKKDNLYKFKKSFYKNDDTFFSIGKRVFNHKIYKFLIDTQLNSDDKIKENNFFPLYRG